ncbi:hypothetical protein [Paenibacillus sp. MZ03-122A]|uniref:hypothetical protein n=1 Tax=Paenibacillus sp. MZ03-122A TaxID=2962033 RepID=UPI0020B8958F|nr:hypothetical protein [Paenibacillus sp. MZ03-122A]
MSACIHPQVPQFSTRKQIQHGLAFEIMDTGIVRMTFSDSKIIDTLNQIGHYFGFGPHVLLDALALHRNCLVMHALYGTGR